MSSAAAIKMSESEAKDAFIIFDESYEGNDVDAHYLADILRAVGKSMMMLVVLLRGRRILKKGRIPITAN